MADKPILCLDFDGVLHSYTSGWQGADVILDRPVPGALEFLSEAIEHFDVQIYSSRSHQPGGIEAMQGWLAYWWQHHHEEPPVDFHSLVKTEIGWPTEKPPAMVTLDDRAITFTGVFPEPADLLEFRPWNKRTTDHANREMAKEE